MTITRTVSFRSSAVSASASLSKAIRDGRYHDLREFLDEHDIAADATTTNSSSSNSSNNSIHQPPEEAKTSDRGPLWEPNSRGWTPMHVAALRNPTMPLRWWKWILLKQQQAASTSSTRESPRCSAELWTRKTEEGQTVVDLFFRASLDPPPWSTSAQKERARALGDAIERILVAGGNRGGGPESPFLTTSRLGSVGKLRKLLGMAETRHEDGNYNEDSDSIHSLRRIFSTIELDPQQQQQIGVGASTDEQYDLASIGLFWKKLTALLKPSAKTMTTTKTSMVDWLADLPWCPEKVARLAIAVCPEPIGKGYSLPLHRYIRSHGSNADGDDHGLLRALCDLHPAAAAVPDPSSGRLPFHEALVGKHSWEGSLRHLYVAHPAAIAVRDPQTGLPTVCLPALRPAQAPASCGSSPMRGCWSYLSRKERSAALANAAEAADRQRLTVVYEVLRRDPSVLLLTAGHDPGANLCHNTQWQ